MRTQVLILSLLVAGFGTAGSVIAGTDSEKQKSIERGAAHYRIFCINCHGEQADGKGPLANLLKIQPTDLTTLRRNSPNGEPVSVRVFNAVSGRHEVGEGQEKKMPTFNDNLEVKTVTEVADFIEAIQK